MVEFFNQPEGTNFVMKQKHGSTDYEIGCFEVGRSICANWTPATQLLTGSLDRHDDVENALKKALQEAYPGCNIKEVGRNGTAVTFKAERTAK